MQEIFDAIKNVFTNMQAIGWAPWPVVFSAAATIIIRIYLEDDILDVTSIEDKRKQGRAKGYAFIAGYIVSVLSCFGFDRPSGVSDGIQALMFSILNSGMGYLAWSFYVVIDPVERFKEKFGKKRAAATPNI